MTLSEHINEICKGLETGSYETEAAVSQGIVLRLLGALGWPTYNTRVVIPEYSVEGRRVDFALCDPPSKPPVFIEVKKVGKIEGAEKQLFEYAFHEGVPIAVLTDGQKWKFFYPIGRGDYRERKVHEMDLIEGDSEESAKRFERYLNYESVCTGDAVKAIEEDYWRRRVERRLPEAWNELVKEKDGLLLDLVAEKVESLCGNKPTGEQVLDFLKSLDRKTELEPQDQFSPQGPLVVTMPGGERISRSFAIDTFIEVIEKLGIEQVKDLNIVVNSIPLIADFEDPKREQRKSGGYYIVSGTDTNGKKRILDRIAKGLGIQQLRVEIIEK